MTIKERIEYVGFDGKWILDVTTNNKLIAYKSDEVREYDLPTEPISNIEHDTDYVFITFESGLMYQIKFEIDSFLVIDSFDSDGDHIESIANHTFGEVTE